MNIENCLKNYFFGAGSSPTGSTGGIAGVGRQTKLPL